MSTPHQGYLWLAGLALCALFLVTACGEKKASKYHWDNVPFCKVPEGKLVGTLKPPSIWVLHKRSTGNGFVLLDGNRSILQPLDTDEVLVAVITCPERRLARLEGTDWSGQFTQDKIPDACNRQKTLVKPTLIKAVKTSNKKYAGKIDFPKLPAASLDCERGTLSYGSGAPVP